MTPFISHIQTNYLNWSLIDNYEWNQGMRTYGLYEVAIDNPGKPRLARETVDVYRDITDVHGIPQSLANHYPIDFEEK